MQKMMLRNMMAMVMTVMMMICNVGDGDEEHEEGFMNFLTMMISGCFGDEGN